MLSSFFVHKNPELLSSAALTNEAWTVEPNDYNTQKKTCGYDMLVGSGWFNSAGYNMIQLQSKIIKLMEVLSMAEGLRVCAWAHNPTHAALTRFFAIIKVRPL